MSDDRRMQRLRIVLPLPPKVLSPNSRCHWATKAQAVKGYRLAARLLAMHQWDSRQKPMASADVTCTFRFGDRRRRDRDNLQASMKAAFDGLADAGIVSDDSAFRHETRIGEVTDDPHVEVVVAEMERA